MVSLLWRHNCRDICRPVWLTWRLMTCDLDQRAIEPEFLRQDVALGEDLVPGRCNVEDAVLIQVLVADDSADHFRPGNRQTFVNLDTGNLELRFQFARRFLGRPV